MRFEGLCKGTVLGALAITVGMGGLGSAAAAPDGRQAAGAQAARLPASLRLAADAVGGVDALRNLRSFRYAATAKRWVLDEGFRTSDEAELAATVTSTVRYVLPTRQAPARVRVDAVRTSNGAARPVDEVLSGRRGFIRGVDANGSTAATKAMPSDRWAAILSEQALLNPQVLLSRALHRPQIAHNGGQVRRDGRLYRVLVLRNAVAPIRMFVDARTGRLARLRTMQADYLRRDVPIEVRYRNWSPAGDGVMFPKGVFLTSDGLPMIREQRGAVAANPVVGRSAFRFPAGVDAGPLDERLARIGAATSQWLMSFANLGFIKDGGQTAINPITITDGQNTADGVTLLGGVANNSMVVQRDNGVVVVEGALHNFRAQAVIRFIRRSPDFTGPITHVVTTHHHADHASGMRPYVALGATVVVGQEAVPFFRQVFRERNSTILPDALDGSNVKARILGVTNAGLSLPGNAQPEVDVFQIPNTHAADMVVPYVRDQGVLFTSDIYSPPTPPSPGDANAQAIVDLVDAQGLNPQWIVGGHGTFISYADFVAALGQ
jgi:glyoxylase-like metal-dependent hydrolase (beta-lactamase superfamily II)